jgi:hypothetical protein
MKSQIHLLKARNECSYCGEGFVTAKNLDKHRDGNCIVRVQQENGDLLDPGAVAMLTAAANKTSFRHFDGKSLEGRKMRENCDSLDAGALLSRDIKPGFRLFDGASSIDARKALDGMSEAGSHAGVRVK